MKPLLVIDLTFPKDPLRSANFVSPLLANLPSTTQTLSFTNLSPIFTKTIARDYAGIILSGTTLKDNEYQKKISKFSFLTCLEIPVLGICAGQHVVAAVFGGKLRRKKESEMGMTKITIEKEDPLLEGLSNPFQAYELHHASVTLPPHFVRLATSDTCENQIIRHETKPIYGVSFHPEVRHETILRQFVQLVKRND